MTDELTFPDSDELCDEKDNDCDSLIDEELNYDYYLDADGDGFGTEDVYVYDCAPGEGYVANTEDCNDANPSISPLANEICDEIDNDCNGRSTMEWDVVVCRHGWRSSRRCQWVRL